MGIIIINPYALGAASVPLGATNDVGSYVPDADKSDVGTGSVVTFTTLSGELEATVIPSGGSGVYTFSWALSKQFENSDTGGRFSVNSTGVTNTSTLRPTIDGARPAGGGAAWDAEFLAQCTVSDGVNTPVVVNVVFMVMAAAF